MPPSRSRINGKFQRDIDPGDALKPFMGLLSEFSAKYHKEKHFFNRLININDTIGLEFS
jgi:hypothetical protein